MALKQFTGRAGCSIPLEPAILVARDFDGEVTTLVGAVAVLEISSAYGAAPRLTVRSDDLPDPPAVFDWEPGALTSTLKVELSPEQTDAVGAGQWVGVIKALGPESGQVNHDVPTMTFQLAIEAWPVAGP